jgi:hypothetical protein
MAMTWTFPSLGMTTLGAPKEDCDSQVVLEAGPFPPQQGHRIGTPHKPVEIYGETPVAGWKTRDCCWTGFSVGVNPDNCQVPLTGMGAFC